MNISYIKTNYYKTDKNGSSIWTTWHRTKDMDISGLDDDCTDRQTNHNSVVQGHRPISQRNEVSWLQHPDEVGGNT